MRPVRRIRMPVCSSFSLSSYGASLDLFQSRLPYVSPILLLCLDFYSLCCFLYDFQCFSLILLLRFLNNSLVVASYASLKKRVKTPVLAENELKRSLMLSIRCVEVERERLLKGGVGRGNEGSKINLQSRSRYRPESLQRVELSPPVRRSVLP